MSKNPELRAADFLILEALHRKPMSTAELARGLQISRSSVTSRVKRFNDMGLLVKQYPDRRWVVKLIVRVETVKETLEQVGLTVPKESDPKLVKVRASQRVSEGSQIALEQPVARVPDWTTPDPPEKPYKPRETSQDVSKRALDMSQKFKMPVHLVELGGELGMGQMGSCRKCGKGTPFVYGVKHLCPLCARSGGGR